MRILFILLFVCSFANGQVIDRFSRFEGYDLAAYTILYDFNAENLGTGSVSTWANDTNATGTADATQGTGSAQPTIVDESGKKAVSFDGGDYLTLGTPSDLVFALGTDTFTIFVIRGTDSGSGGGTYFSDRNGSQRDFNVGQTGATSYLLQIGNSNQTIKTVSSGSTILFTAEVNTTDVNTWVDGINVTNSSIGTDNSTNRAKIIGARSTIDTYFDGTIRRIVVMSPAPNGTDRDAIETILINSF